MSTITQDQLHSFLEPCRDIALRAGAAIQAIAREALDVRDKADGSPLTRADRAAHEIIVAGLADLTPEIPVLSEEGDVDGFAPGPDGVFWLVDPLDGTKEFIAGLADYTVNIALVEDGRPILGVIFAPAVDVLFWGGRDCGAWRRADAQPPQPIHANRKHRPESAVVSRSHLSPETQEFLDRLGVTESLAHGSSIKICAVAEGRADLYPRHGPTCLWDTGAGAAIARAAGCDVVDLAGQPLGYDPADGIKHAGFLVYPTGMDLSEEGSGE